MQIYKNYQSHKKEADRYPALNSALTQTLCHHSLTWLDNSHMGGVLGRVQAEERA